MRVWRRPHAFDAGRGELGTYLRLMARSRALDLWREGQAWAGRRTASSSSSTPSRRRWTSRRPPSPSATARARPSTALQQLPEPQRDAIVLAYWGGLTAGEIADREQVPLGTAKSRIRLGLARLRRGMPCIGARSGLAGTSLVSNSRSTAEPAGHDARPGGGPFARRGRSAGGRRLTGQLGRTQTHNRRRTSS